MSGRTIGRAVLVFSTPFFVVASLAGQSASHPALQSSTLGYHGGSLVGIDAGGSAYISARTAPGVTTFTKLNPNGSAAFSVTTLPMEVLAADADSSGAIYVTGICGSGCPAPTTTFGVPGGTTSGAYIGKLNASANGFVWLDLIADASASRVVMAVDATGNVFVGGSAGCQLATTAGAFQPQCAASALRAQPAFVAKISSDGSREIYSTFLRGTTDNSETATALAVDAGGNAYVTGSALSDWPASAGAFETNGTGSAFSGPSYIAKIASDGSKLLYSTFFNEGITGGIAVDNLGAAYVTGVTGGQLPVTAGAAETAFPAWQPTAGNPTAAFVVKLNPAGSALQYGTYVGLLASTTLDFAHKVLPSIAVDGAGNAYVAGQTLRPDVTTINAVQSSFAGPAGVILAGDAAIAGLNAQGSAYLFTTYLGGVQQDLISALRIASDGLLHVGGSTVANEFPAVAGIDTLYGLQNTPFAAALNLAGTAAVPLLTPTQVSGNPPDGFHFFSTTGGTLVGDTANAPVHLGNYGAAATPVGGITTSGDFRAASDCPASLAAGARCTVTVTFAPGAIGERNGSLTVSAGAQTASMKLIGTGQGAVVETSASQLSFGAQAVGTSSPPQTVALTNTGNIGLMFTAINTQGDFSQSNNCGASIAPAQSCAVQVVFGPTVSGQRSGTLTLASNALGSPTVISLSGGASPDFTLGAASGASTTQTVAAGQTALYNLSLAPQGGFSGTVALSCSGAPPGATCSPNPSSLNVTGNSAANFTVNVSTAARSSNAEVLAASVGPRAPLALAVWAIGGFWFVLRRRRFASEIRPLFAVTVLALITLVGCGGGSKPSSAQTGTPAGSYTIVVTASSGSTTHTQNLTLVVQ